MVPLESLNQICHRTIVTTSVFWIRSEAVISGSLYNPGMK